jgi:hypothetical protein
MRMILLVVGLLGASPSFAGDAWLFIGDSHSVGSFGQRFDELLRGIEGAEVTQHASCGSSPSWWFTGQPTSCGFLSRDAEGRRRRGLRAPTPVLPALLAELRPAVTVVALGANLVNAPRDHALRTSRELAEAIVAAKSRCVWIGPPHGRNKPEPGFSEFYVVLREAVGPGCDFIDSRPFARYPDRGGDGVHYDHLGPEGVAIARRWAEEVFALLRK